MENKPLRVVMSYVSQPNTPESDLQREVMHTVELSDGTKRQLMAECPIDAQEKMDARLKREAQG